MKSRQDERNDTGAVREAEVFGSYLLGFTPSKRSVALYEQAIGKLELIPVEGDERWLKFVLHYPVTLGFMDSALALTRPNSVLRRKLLVMLAILEVCPEYADLFLPAKTPRRQLVYIGWAGLRAAGKALTGLVLLRLVK